MEVIQEPIEKVELERGSVDVVVSFDVIEHLFDPGAFIRSCSSILVKGGLLVLTCPNIKGFDVSVLRALSDTVDVEHINYFHPESISSLVQKQGFGVLEVTTPGRLDAELVRKKVLAGEFDISERPFLKRILIDEWQRIGGAFQKFLEENHLSSHMWLVARKS